MSVILRRLSRDLTLFRRAISACSHSTSSNADATVLERKRNFVAERTAYNKELTDLRKQFAKEIFENQRQKVASQKRRLAEEMALAKQRRKEKQERKAAAQPQLGEEDRRQREEREAQRLEREGNRLKREVQIQARRDERVAKLHTESGGWIERENLESRVHDAVLNPIQI